MTKADLAQFVYQRIGGFSKREAADLVDLVFDTIKDTLSRGEDVKISGYGNFVLRDKVLRQGRNPRTGEQLPIPERRVLLFRASRLLRQRLNESAPAELASPAVTSPALREELP